MDPIVGAALLALSAAPVLAAPAVVTAPRALVRMTPSAVGPIVATAARGEAVAVSEQVDVGWRAVTLADGRGGYIADGEVRIIGAARLGVPDDDRAGARTAVRASLRLTGLSLFGVGVEVSQRLGSMLGLDVTVTEEDFGDDRPGIGAEALLRIFAGDHRHVASAAFGPSVHAAPEYGAVGFFSGELAYEYRPVKLPSVLVGGGVDIVLHDSGTATCMGGGSGWFPCGLFWNDSYRAGNVHGRFRVAFGGSF
jgi:hypothetical protein